MGIAIINESKRNLLAHQGGKTLVVLNAAPAKRDTLNEAGVLLPLRLHPFPNLSGRFWIGILPSSQFRISLLINLRQHRQSLAHYFLIELGFSRSVVSSDFFRSLTSSMLTTFRIACSSGRSTTSFFNNNCASSSRAARWVAKVSFTFSWVSARICLTSASIADAVSSLYSFALWHRHGKNSGCARPLERYQPQGHRSCRTG